MHVAPELSRLLRALLEAKAFSFGDGTSKDAAVVGAGLSYTAKNPFNGKICWWASLQPPCLLKPGDEFEIKLGKKQIRLIPAGCGRTTGMRRAMQALYG